MPDPHRVAALGPCVDADAPGPVLVDRSDEHLHLDGSAFGQRERCFQRQFLDDTAARLLTRP
ncbi:hypothetical protein, partial [Streptomyces sp. H51]|uniref:hypothetical protein n=1 Tax=Streptomyces sp. H51 TaxID=3111770 RepID=UPI002D771A12